jgi:hypothetical protein
MSTAQARVVDPILSTVARGYQNAKMVGGALFPYVPVQARGGKIMMFGKEAFRLYQTQRSPGSNTKRVQIGYEAGSFALESHSLEGVLAEELGQEANAVPGIDLASGTVRTVQDIFALRLEHAQAQAARNAAAYGSDNTKTLTLKARWDDPATTSDPVKEIEQYKEFVRSQTGQDPMTVVMGKKVWKTLKNHPAIIDRIKYTGVGTPKVTEAIVKELFEVDTLMVGSAVYWDDTASKFVDVWGGDLILASTETGTMTDRGRPTYGYTYRLSGYPIVEKAYQDRNAKSWMYPVTDEVAPVIAMPSAGFLLKNAAAA